MDTYAQPNPIDMEPLLEYFSYMLSPPKGLSLAHFIEHYVDLVPWASLANAPTYNLSPSEDTNIEFHLKSLS